MSWSLVYEGFDPGEEGLREALCTLGNGRFATRGALPEARADEVHYPGCYLAGGYNRRTTTIQGRDVVNEDLVNLPNWLPFSFRIAGGPWLAPGAFEIEGHRIELDLERGVLLRSTTFRDGEGRGTRLEQRRLVHMADPHLAALETRITALDWSGRIEIRSGLDGEVENAGVARYRDL
jgi:trehalose/maltose hydrolase-like predicted phosphorylase